MDINWYPGHMKKTIESIEANKARVDLVITLLDARIPISSHNPLLEKALEGKPVLYLLNKSDLAEEEGNRAWVEYLSGKQDSRALAWRSTGRPNRRGLMAAIEALSRDRLQRDRDRGMRERKVRIMVTGIPNVGKSTFINQMAGRKSTKVGNRPGVTKTNQWIRLDSSVDLLDTPGVLWPKLDPPIRGRHLAYTGSIKDEIMDVETLALRFLEEAEGELRSRILARYDIQDEKLEGLELMEAIARRRGAIGRGGSVDYTQVANIVLGEFRSGTLGPVTLEYPEDGEQYHE
ncbi:MAG: ribosome biogenesis GTPase YlqF [Tissierellia bacterium]|nr:ribosome biogenesis GTPase YlqF [Tissierellia bacterium]